MGSRLPQASQPSVRVVNLIHNAIKQKQRQDERYPPPLLRQRSPLFRRVLGLYSFDPSPSFILSNAGVSQHPVRPLLRLDSQQWEAAAPRTGERVRREEVERGEREKRSVGEERLEAEGIGFAFHVVELTRVGEVEKVRSWEVEKMRDQKQKAPALRPLSSSHPLPLSSSAHRPRRLVFRHQRLHGLHYRAWSPRWAAEIMRSTFSSSPAAARRIGGAVAGHEDLLVRGAHVGLAGDE